MKRNDSRIIVNLNLEDEELQERVHLAVEEYVNRYINSDRCRERIDNLIQRRVEERLKEYTRYSNANMCKVFKANNENVNFSKAVEIKVDEAVANYLNSGTIAKQVVNKLARIFEDEN